VVFSATHYNFIPIERKKQLTSARPPACAAVLGASTPGPGCQTQSHLNCLLISFWSCGLKLKTRQVTLMSTSQQ